jgi:hypothetical protein
MYFIYSKQRNYFWQCTAQRAILYWAKKFNKIAFRLNENAQKASIFLELFGVDGVEARILSTVDRGSP